ncbi:MAG: SIS domain-containing protein [Alphaproteobacteria bacterium]
MGGDEHLKGLYPFLHGERPNTHDVDAALLESVRQKANHNRAVLERFFADHGGEVVETAKAIAAVYRRKGRMFCMGNGGSACDAAHFAVEFIHPVTAGRPALPAVNLTTDITMITALGNDVGFAQIFRRQIIAQATAGDGLIGFSTSGNSENLLLAFDKAKEMGLVTMVLVGQDGGKAKRSNTIDHYLVVEDDSIHRIQECHVAIYHILWDLVHTLLADDRGSAGTEPLGKSA